MQFLIGLACTLVLLLVVLPASSQPVDANPEFIKRALDVVVSQRNAAMDQAASAQAQLMQARDDLARARAKIKALEDPGSAAPSARPSE